MQEQRSELCENFPETGHRISLTNFELGQSYFIFNRIKKGKHSTIYYGIEKQSKKERAFKFYNFKELQQTKSFQEKQICKRISKKEWEIMQKCQSVNMLSCENVYENRDYKVMVLEYCQDTLSHEIQSRQFKQISQIRAIGILRQILIAIRRLNQNYQQLHTSLRPEHILVKNGIYKLIDFGLPSLLGQNPQEEDPYVAPQIRMKKSFDSKAQVWSVGLLFYVILFGELPSLLKSRLSNPLSVNPSSSMYDGKKSNILPRYIVSFLKECLQIDPQRRLSWQQLQKSPLFGHINLPTNYASLLTRNTISIKQIIEINIKEPQISIILPLQEQNEQITETNVEQRSLHSINNFDLMRKNLQKQIQKEYVKVGYLFQIKPIECTIIDYLKEQINKDQSKYYKQIRQFYLQCLKVDFILRYIVKQLPNSKQRSIVELKYLIIGTCFTAISRLNDFQKKKKNNGSKYQNLLQNCLSRQTLVLYSEVKSIWNQQSEKLVEIQSKFSNILFDKVKSFTKKQEEKEKEKFLNGIQKIDFKQKQKIQFTQHYFTKHLKEIQKQKSIKIEPNSLVLQYMNIYVKIWEIDSKAKVEEKYSSLKNYIDREILKKFSSIVTS